MVGTETVTRLKGESGAAATRFAVNCPDVILLVKALDKSANCAVGSFAGSVGSPDGTWKEIA